MNIDFLKQRLTAYERLMRLDRPIGILLLLWPTLWAVWVVWSGRPDPVMLWIFVLGTVLMRSAGCVINDLADARFDGHVERTRERPLVTGAVSKREALMLTALLLLAALSLVLFLNRVVVLYAVGALAVAAVYPFTKRFLALPQAWLGLAFGFGIPMAFAARMEAVPAVAWWMMAANLFWVIAYDTEYAMVDRDDDLRIGIKTAAITFGRFDVVAVMLCYMAALGVLVYVGTLLNFGLAYGAGLAAAALIMIYHFFLIRGRTREACFKAFLHNNWIGAAVFAGIVVEYLSRRNGPWILN